MGHRGDHVHRRRLSGADTGQRLGAVSAAAIGLVARHRAVALAGGIGRFGVEGEAGRVAPVPSPPPGHSRRGGEGQGEVGVPSAASLVHRSAPAGPRPWATGPTSPGALRPLPPIGEERKFSSHAGESGHRKTSRPRGLRPHLQKVRPSILWASAERWKSPSCKPSWSTNRK